MTQATDLGNVATGTGLNVRQNLNTNIQSLATLNSGANPPSPTYQFMPWQNDTGKIIYKRNSTNTAWSIEVNYGATTDPGTGDDSADGYIEGSMWINVTLNKVFFCADPAAGAAVWKEVTTPGGTTNAFGNIVVSGQTTIAADSAPDTLTIVGTGITLFTDAATDTLTISPTYGAAVNTVCQGNDSRLSDARPPSAHASQHGAGGADPIRLDQLAAPLDNTTLDASTSAHGLMRKLPTGGTGLTYYNDLGGFTTPSGGGTAAQAFGTIVVSGQSNVVADAAPDSVTFVGNNGINITTTAASDTVAWAPVFGSTANTFCQGNDPRLSSIPTRVAVNVKDFGALGDGVTNDTTAILAAAAEAASRKCMLYFPSGTYVIKQQIIFTNVPVSITGDGLNLSVLHWTSDASSRGIYASANDARQFHLITDITLATSGTTGKAIELDYSDQIVDVGGGSLNTMDRMQPRFIIDSVLICGMEIVTSGNPFNTGWAVGIETWAAVDSLVTDTTILGRAQSAYQGYAGSFGMWFHGNPGSGSFENGHPCVAIVERSYIYFCEIGIQYRNYEGCFVSTTNILGCDYGINIPSDYHQPQFNITNCHINCFIRGIYALGQTQGCLMGNLIYAIQTSNGFGGIYLTDCDQTLIIGNTFQPFSVNMTGIVLDESDDCIIANNMFAQNQTNWHVTGIWLNSTSGGNKVVYNTFSGGGFASTVTDDGAGNTVV